MPNFPKKISNAIASAEKALASQNDGPKVIRGLTLKKAEEVNQGGIPSREQLSSQWKMLKAILVPGYSNVSNAERKHLENTFSEISGASTFNQLSQLSRLELEHLLEVTKKLLSEVDKPLAEIFSTTSGHEEITRKNFSTTLRQFIFLVERAMTEATSREQAIKASAKKDKKPVSALTLPQPKACK